MINFNNEYYYQQIFEQTTDTIDILLDQRTYDNHILFSCLTDIGMIFNWFDLFLREDKFDLKLIILDFITIIIFKFS